MESGEGEISSTCPDRHWDPPSPLYNGYRVFFPGVKRPGRGVNHLPPASAEVTERVEPLLRIWAFMACARANFTFTIFLCVIFRAFSYIIKKWIVHVLEKLLQSFTFTMFVDHNLNLWITCLWYSGLPFTCLAGRVRWHGEVNVVVPASDKDLCSGLLWNFRVGRRTS
jgi:hypothetical protein